MAITASKLLASRQPLSPEEERRLFEACAKQLGETLARRMATLMHSMLEETMRYREPLRFLPLLPPRPPQVIYIVWDEAPGLN